MNDVVREANVYFLPALPPVPAAPPALSAWRRLRARFRGGMWRLQLAAAGLRAAFRRREAIFADDEAMALFGEQRAHLIERRPRLAPARIIDLGSARERLRPLVAAR
jgi:hypothetical protein